MEIIYDRKRKNIFGIPSSVKENVALIDDKFNIISNFEKVAYKDTDNTDINELLVSLFDNDEFKKICENNNKERFVTFLYNNGILTAAAESDHETRGWLTAHAYVATETVAVAALQVLAIVGAVAVALAVRKVDEDSGKTLYIKKEIRNPILNVCRTAAHKLGGSSFGENIHELFYGLENGKYVIDVEGDGHIVKSYKH